MPEGAAATVTDTLAVVMETLAPMAHNKALALNYRYTNSDIPYLKGDPDIMQLYAQRFEEAVSRLEELGEGYSTTDSYRSGAVRKPRT